MHLWQNIKVRGNLKMVIRYHIARVVWKETARSPFFSLNKNSVAVGSYNMSIFGFTFVEYDTRFYLNNADVESLNGFQ